MQPRRHAFLHQGMIGGMEVHEIGAGAACVDDSQAGRVFIGEAAKLDRFSRTEIPAESG